MVILGLKGTLIPNQLDNRLEKNPDLYEIHLSEADLFGEKYIDLENNILTVLIDLFGQETPVEVEINQVNVA